MQRTLPHPATRRTRNQQLPPPEWASKGRYKELLIERGLPVVEAGDVKDWGSVGFAVAWKPTPGLLAKVCVELCVVTGSLCVACGRLRSIAFAVAWKPTAGLLAKACCVCYAQPRVLLMNTT